MPWVQCSRCRYIRESSKSSWELNTTHQNRSPGLPKGAYCIQCGTENQWLDYTGPLAPTILAKERHTYEETVVFYKQKETVIKGLGETRKNKEKEFELNFGKRFKSEAKASANEAFLMMHTEIQLCFDLIVSMTEELAGLARRLNEMTNPDVIERDAAVVAGHAKKNASGGLVLGNRQFVSVLSPAQILDAANWSWGLNISWVEGGVNGKADFELVLNPDNPYHTIPPGILTILQGRPSINCDDFLVLCREQGSGTLLWYDAGDENRPTWTALEIATLLRAGYEFVFLNQQVFLRKISPRKDKK
ncbi:hypothetical protein ABFV57_19845 [Pseudomonas neuropathica]|uniref:hypothetical protein n=1 Tax=Pseudomonas neuropathica TaxID=2730425 RepID=UPI0034D7A045